MLISTCENKGQSLLTEFPLCSTSQNEMCHKAVVFLERVCAQNVS